MQLDAFCDEVIKKIWQLSSDSGNEPENTLLNSFIVQNMYAMKKFQITSSQTELK